MHQATTYIYIYIRVPSPTGGQKAGHRPPGTKDFQHMKLSRPAANPSRHGLLPTLARRRLDPMFEKISLYSDSDSDRSVLRVCVPA